MTELCKSAQEEAGAAEVRVNTVLYNTHATLLQHTGWQSHLLRCEISYWELFGFSFESTARTFTASEECVGDSRVM